MDMLYRKGDVEEGAIAKRCASGWFLMGGLKCGGHVMGGRILSVVCGAEGGMEEKLYIFRTNCLSMAI